jgi:hypothetical protein
MVIVGRDQRSSSHLHTGSLWWAALQGLWNEDSLLHFHYDALITLVSRDCASRVIDVDETAAIQKNVFQINALFHSGSAPCFGQVKRGLEKYVNRCHYPYLDPTLPVNSGVIHRGLPL